MRILRNKNWNQKKNFIFYPTSKSVVELLNKDITFLKKKSRSNPLKKGRLCIHSNIKDDIHQMIIYHSKGTYIRPHKHLNKEESYLLLQGEMDVVLFDNKGNVTKVIKMGNLRSKKIFFFRMKKSIFRTLIMKKDSIFLEIKQGPFTKKNVIWASWSPDIDNEIDSKIFLKDLKKEIGKI